MVFKLAAPKLPWRMSRQELRIELAISVGLFLVAIGNFLVGFGSTKDDDLAG